MSEQYREDTASIQITFPVPVNISQAQTRALIEVISDICHHYEKHHQDRVMWAAGVGGLMTSMPWTKEDEENGVPLDFDMSVLSVECFERERYEGERGPEKHEWFRPSRPFEACRKCGMVRREDGKNGRCKGHVSVGLREASQSPAQEEGEK